MFTLAHISDVHLGPLPEGAALRNFALKRIIGTLSWKLNRHKQHDPAIAQAIADDIAAAAPDHIAVTGDIVNVAAYDEFPRAAQWLRSLGEPKNLSFVPGNHDAYVACPWAPALAHLAPWMAGDMNVGETITTRQLATPFPFVRLRKNVALIGLSTAEPQSLINAGGRLGKTQIASLATLLNDLRERGYARVIMIHHPPLPGLAPSRKALRDADKLRTILEREGAELVLHGHNHRVMINEIKTRFGPCHIIGVPSASMADVPDHTPAAWHQFRIHRQDGLWHIKVTARGFKSGASGIAMLAEFDLVS